MMGLYLDCVDVKELWVLEMKKNVPYELSHLIINTADKLYLIVSIPERNRDLFKKHIQT